MKDIKGYEGLYAITSCGKVYSYKNKKFLSPAYDRGYPYINLFKVGTPFTVKIHRLVAEAYIPNPHKYKEVNHKDENKQNNSILNLEWCDRAYNCNYGTRIERMGKRVFCEELNKEFPSAREAHRKTGIWQSSIRRCCCGELKTAGKMHWKYV